MLILGVAAAAPAAPSASDGARLARPCLVCHQMNAWGSADGIVPSLAGQQPRYLEKQLAMFRSGSRVDAAMQSVTTHEISKNPAEVRALVRYLASLEPNPDPVTGSGENLRVGQELYEHICAACHGTAGRGDANARVPRIAGQHYPYLRQQIESAAEFHRDLAPSPMTSALRSLRPAEKDALADYLSQLGHSEGLLR